MSPLSSQGGHSAKVKMQLLINGSTINISQMAPEFLLVEEPINHGPNEATLVLQVDESEDRWNVYLPQGISIHSNRVKIAPLPEFTLPDKLL